MIQFIEKVLNANSLTYLTEVIKPSISSSFSDFFQDRFLTQEKSAYVPFSVLLEAVTNSEELFAQYPVDVRRIREIAKSIFVDEGWLITNPQLVMYNTKPYIVGGRHRVYAINSVFYSLAKLLNTHRKGEEPNSEAVIDTYNEYLSLDIRVNVGIINDSSFLIKLIINDNKTRTMRSSETSHLGAQWLGADVTSPDKASAVGLTNDLKRTDKIAYCAQNFARRSHPRLNTQTLFELGQIVSKLLIYGKTAGITNKTSMLIQSVDEFNLAMDECWDILCTEIEGKSVVSRKALSIGESIYKTYKENQFKKLPLIEAVQSINNQLEEAKANGVLEDKTEDYTLITDEEVNESPLVVTEDSSVTVNTPKAKTPRKSITTNKPKNGKPSNC